MYKTVLTLVLLVSFVFPVLADPAGNQPSACETLHAYHRMCTKAGTTPDRLSTVPPTDPDYCRLEANMILSSTTRPERQAIGEAMASISKMLDKDFKRLGAERDPELVRQHGKHVADFYYSCVTWCANGLKGKEPAPYDQFREGCPLDSAKNR